MKLENQVISLDLAKRLKELGVKQGSFWYWCKIAILTGHQESVSHEWQLLARGGQGLEYSSAFTVAELGEMLPEELVIDGEWSTFLETAKAEKAWHVYYHNDDMPRTLHLEYADSESDARAKMLIYLIENKLVTV